MRKSSLLLFFICMIVVFGQQNQVKNVRAGLEVEFGYAGDRSQYISSIPISARTVPTHPGDPKNWKFVLPDNGMYVETQNMFLSVGPKLILKKRLGFTGGPIWNIPISGEASFAQVNQYGGSSRGTGMSLVWGKGVSKLETTPGYFAESEYFLGSAFSVIGGYEMNRITYALDRGYDRYDERSTLDSIPLAKYKIAGPKFGVKIGVLGNQGGKVIALKATASRLGNPELGNIPKYLTPKSDWAVKVSLVFGFVSR